MIRYLTLICLCVLSMHGLAQTPVHHWQLDSAANAPDIQGTLNGTLVGNLSSNFVADADGNSNSALEFPNTTASPNNYIQLNGSDSSLAFITNTTQFTISIDFRISVTTVDQMLMGNWKDSTVKGFYVGFIGKKVAFRLGAGDGILANALFLSGTTEINDQNWHKVTVTGDGNFLSIYLDDVLENSMSLSGFPTTSGNDDDDVFIGARNDQGSSDQPFRNNGALDEIKIYDQAVAPSTSGGSASIPCQSQSLVHYWGADGNMTDAVGSLNGQQLGTGVTYVNDADNNASSAVQIAVDASSYIHLVNSKSDLKFISNSGIFSLSLDFKLGTSSAQQTFLGNYTGLSQAGFYLGYLNSKLVFSVSTGNGAESGRKTIEGTTVINDQNWHTVTVTGDGSFINIYLDGTQDAAASIASLPFPTTDNDNTLDVYLGGQNDNGSLIERVNDIAFDDIRVYNTTLSSTEVADIAAGTCNSSTGGSSLWSNSGETTNIFYENGKVSVGVDYQNNDYAFAVKGKILAEGLRVQTYANWPDYVFYKNYPLMPLEELEAYLKENQHLPGVPSAAEVKEHGVSLEVINAILLEKIEELSLHVIDQNKRIKRLEKIVLKDK